MSSVMPPTELSRLTTEPRLTTERHLTTKLREFLIRIMGIAVDLSTHGVTVEQKAPLLGNKGGILIVQLPSGIQLSVTIPSGRREPILVCPIQDGNLILRLEKKMRTVEKMREEIYRLRFVTPEELFTSQDVVTSNHPFELKPASALEVPFWKHFNCFNRPEDGPEFERRVLGLQAALIASDDPRLLTDSSPFR